MKLATRISIFIIGILLLSACSSHHPALNADEWKYQPNAITIDLIADQSLNTINGNSHTLLLSVIQTAKLQDVQHYLQNPAGISTLLEKSNAPEEAQKFYINKFFISPGEKNVLSLTRMAGMKYVVLVAGYSTLNPDQTVKIFEVPVDSHVDGIKLWKRIYYPAPLNIHLHLGNQGILKAYSIQ